MNSSTVFAKPAAAGATAHIDEARMPSAPHGLCLEPAPTCEGLQRIFVKKLKGQQSRSNGSARGSDLDGVVALHFFTRSPSGTIDSCVEISLGSPPDCPAVAHFGLTPFQSAYDRAYGYLSKVTLARSARGTGRILSLMTAITAYCMAMDASLEIAFYNCHPKLVALFGRYGFRPFGVQYHDPLLGPQVPLYFLPIDVPHMARVNAAFRGEPMPWAISRCAWIKRLLQVEQTEQDVEAARASERAGRTCDSGLFPHRPVHG